MAFNPNEHLIKIGTGSNKKDYLPVQWRLVWFREVCPNGTIDTQEKEIDLDRETEAEGYAWNEEKHRSEKVIKRARGYARFYAVVTNGTGGRATGTKSEKAASFQDFIEKSETGSIGRALAALGYGTQFTDEEFSEGERLADAPVARQSQSSRPGAGQEKPARASTTTAHITNGAGSAQPTPVTGLEAKKALVRQMAGRLGLTPPPIDKMEESAIDNLIEMYKKEHSQRQQSAKAEKKARAELETEKAAAKK